MLNANVVIQDCATSQRGNYLLNFVKEIIREWLVCLCRYFPFVKGHNNGSVLIQTLAGPDLNTKATYSE